MGKVLKAREIGDPILNKISEEINIGNIDNEVIDIIEDLKSTLEYGTGLGIAAPQIGINKRIIVVGAKKENIKYNDAEEIPITVMINPVWKKLSDETDIQFEGCMSIPNIRGKVRRYKQIELTYYNENGNKITKRLSGFFARLVQHECDHLDGINFIEKVISNNGFATKENIEKYSLRDKEYNENKYKVITLCGSTKFKDEFIKVQRELTLDGNIVISLSLFGHSGDSEVWENMDEGTSTKTKKMLDEMHRRKIDMSDEIFVINVGEYIGDSTKNEIEIQITENEGMYSFQFENTKIPKIQTGNEINRIALVSSIVISLLGITTGIIILKRKRS